MTDPRHAHRSTDAASTDTTHHRAIKSFVLRTGRVTTGQEKALSTLGPQYIVPFQAVQASSEAPAAPHFDWDATFGRTAPRILEIGFGMGEATAHIARVMPDKDFICCEVHTPGVGALLKRIGDSQTPVATTGAPATAPLTNIRILQHDAVQVLHHMIADGSLHGVHIFFPDPWHKSRHHKRRLIQAPLVQLLAQKLQTGGYIHAATDWENYAEQILEVLQHEPQLTNTSPHANGYADKPHYRPLTKFESRGLRLGHGVWDVVFEKR